LEPKHLVLFSIPGVLSSTLCLYILLEHSILDGRNKQVGGVRVYFSGTLQLKGTTDLPLSAIFHNLPEDCGGQPFYCGSDHH
jgi:hypothetical protein